MIETTNIKLKKWQSADLVTDMLTWINTNADSIDASVGLLESGVVEFQVVAQATGTGHVNFAKGFTAPPAVVATLIAQWPADHLAVQVWNITKDGFDAQYHNKHTSLTRTVRVAWIAHGV